MHKQIALFLFSILSLPPQRIGVEAKTLNQQAYMVWDGACKPEITLTDKLRLEAPMVDGRPDMDHAVIKGQRAAIDMTCGRIEIRKGIK